MRDGDPLLYVERGGRGILRLASSTARSWPTRSRSSPRPPRRARSRSSAIERVDGEPAIGSGYEEALVEAGFTRQPRRLVAAA